MLAQKAPDYRREAALLKKALAQYHFQPRIVDDQFSRDVYDTFIESIDGNRLLLTTADLKTLSSFREKLDDELNGQEWRFLNTATPIIRRAIERTITIIRKQAEIPFELSTSAVFFYDTLNWPSDEVQLQERWCGYLHYQTLDRMAYTREPIKGDAKAFFLKSEPAMRAKVSGIEARSYERILNHPAGFENFIATTFFQSITLAFDAHSMYMNVNEMENFLSEQSTEGYYFGISIDEDDHGTVLITSVTPGSPAAKSGLIEVGDEVLSVHMENQPLIATGLSIDEINEILSDAHHKPVEFHLRSSSGIDKSVKLTKAKIEMEQNFVRSFLLAGANGERYGYIHLPHFYTRWGEESEGSRCANDVAMEVIKLSKEKIQGIILDVRDNGGGSLAEAAALAGIFIDEGPLAITRNSLNALVPYKDTFRGTIFSGPLIVMVNNQSASASEFLAAALQDYRRALIVGSRTFGKATAQVLYPLDPNQPEPSLASVKSGIGFATITMEKIYRVTGKTAQHLGVIPDVSLPYIHMEDMVRESDMPFALRADSVQRKTFFKPSPDFPIASLQQRSARRIENATGFKTIQSTDQWLSANVGPAVQPVSLNWNTFLEKAKDDMLRLKHFEAVLSDTTNLFEVKNDVRDEYRIGLDEYTRTYNNQWIKKLKSDIYLEEVFQIMNDLLELTSQNKK